MLGVHAVPLPYSAPSASPFTLPHSILGAGDPNVAAIGLHSLVEFVQFPSRSGVFRQLCGDLKYPPDRVCKHGNTFAATYNRLSKAFLSYETRPQRNE